MNSNRKEFLKNNEHLVPEIVKNISESFEKPWVTEYDKNMTYYQLDAIRIFIEESLQKNSKYKHASSRRK